MSGSRLPSGGSRILRSKQVNFTFDGETVEAFDGDSVASALLASGRTTLARSFKYHRPRGVFTAGSEEPSALVTLNEGAHTVPNAKATMVAAKEGLIVRSQNAWPSLKYDVGAVNGLFSRFFAAGFYYKTFMGPFRSAWMVYEPFIRRAAGLGRASKEADPDRYEKANAMCDVLVVGAGVAGLAAARMAALSGKRVILTDENPVLGGQVDLDGGQIGSKPVQDWIADWHKEITSLPNLQILTSTSVYGYYDDNVLAAVQQTDVEPNDRGKPREWHWRFQAKHVVLACGSIERPIVFPGNDLPGVMLLSAGLAYAERYGVAIGQKTCIFANNDTAWRRAVALSAAGVTIKCIIDPRTDVPNHEAGTLRDSGTKIRAGHIVQMAEGKGAIDHVSIAPYDHNSSSLNGPRERIACDALLVSGGYTPTIHLASQAGSPPVFNDQLAAFLPGNPREQWIAAGAIAGNMGLTDALADGTQAGVLASSNRTVDHGGNAVRSDPPNDHDGLFPLFEVPEHVSGSGKAFVDLQHDVTASDVRLANREGFSSVEHAKRYTTLGMAADQGKTSNVTGLAILANAQKKPIAEVGTTRFRPPYTPVSLGAIVGRETGQHFRPLRRTPMHSWHVEAGADMIEAGLWRRPQVYRKGSETVEQAYIREARAVRTSVGITDVSTLGKIDVQGPDAGQFLDLVYTNTFSTLPVGKARYGLMLREDGFLYDDGTTWRLSETQYLMTTTTTGAGNVMANLEYLLATAFPDLRVALTSVSDQWAGLAIAGPEARALLKTLVDDVDVSNQGLPFMGVRNGTVDGIPVLIARLSFSGELAYEIYAASDFGLALWQRVMEAGKTFDCVPYGLEALGALRIEKGHIAGLELDGRTSVHDVGLEKMISKKKDCVGKALALRTALTSSDRPQLVGLKSLDGKPVRGGAHLVRGEHEDAPGSSEGHVTSMAYSPMLECYIALGLLRDGRARHGKRLYAADPVRDSHGPVEVVSPHFFDPEGSRMHG